MLLADPADNIPVGAPYSGANAPIKSGRILEGRSRGRHFRERTPTSRVRSEMSQTSALPSTLTRTVARVGNRDSTPGSEASHEPAQLLHAPDAGLGGGCVEPCPRARRRASNPRSSHSSAGQPTLAALPLSWNTEVLSDTAVADTCDDDQ